MLKVNLAGYNIDSAVVEKMKKEGWDGKNNISPETISAAYARISRDPRPVDELRADAREEVDKARKSNENIVFKMGHHSVAEHAYLNFDILGLSRFAVESLEEARLCAYTEKSQRYITLRGDYVTPDEFTKEEKKIFMAAVAVQVEAYKTLFPVLHEYQRSKNSGMLQTKTGQNVVEGWAKEDARYVLPLATECQLGFSCNARNLEHIIRKLKYSPFEEVRTLAKTLYDRAVAVVPSLIILSDPDAFRKQFGAEVSDGLLRDGKVRVEKAVKKAGVKTSGPGKIFNAVRLVDCTENPEIKIIAAMMHTSTGNMYADCIKSAVKLGTKGRKAFFVEIFKGLNAHDSLYREFETVNFVYEIIMSSSAFGQMKRHRMMSMTKQDYDIRLGYTIPPAIIETKQVDIYKRAMDAGESAYKKISKIHPEAAVYVLTNAHRRRVLVNANLREVYHIARLRMDGHAQWDIRDISGGMIAETKKAAPVAAALACGKDVFSETYSKFMKG
ncbi:MAG: FAD-dependent thymidylate synthase [Spirochaetia bacterium]|nr:FAD-dependent thymidylate synthase [Spirochaetia bacterium]